MTRFWMLILLFTPTLTWAQIARPGDPEYMVQGRLVTLRVVPKDRNAKIFLAGIEAADIDFKKNAKLVSVVLVKDQHKQILHFSPNGDSYEVDGVPSRDQVYELRVETRVKDQTEHLNVKINPRKP